jgi:hypothetical protein
MNIRNMPIIYDIPPKNLWVPFGAAAACYVSTKLGYPLVIKLLAKCFPREEDHLPLAKYRTRIRQRILDDIDNQYPCFAFFVKKVIPDNLHISAFIVSIIILKTSTRTHFSGLSTFDKIFRLVAAIHVMCYILVVTRRITAEVIDSISYRCRFGFVSNLLSKLARIVDPDI